METIRGALDQMPFERIAFMGVDGHDCEDLCQHKDEKSGVERERHCLEKKYSGM